ncbi:Leucine aminopeptidase 2 [Lachnellula arida]|uniref:Peptide hydrolase n=1 Tax=Lachnellula arida TaxID=1316785 RepID=A0A8T9BP57_9HELO|nr:Leucine aminopeptidase 2 [Lachnellula arida]
MKFCLPLVALCTVSFTFAVPTAPSNPIAQRDLPLVQSNQLRQVLLRSELLKKAKILEDFAYSTPQRNRLIGTPGHNATVNWITDTIAQFPNYYTYYLEPFDLSLGVSANLTNNGSSMEVFAVGLSPAGHVSGPLVYVPNLGCETGGISMADGEALVARVQAGETVIADLATEMAVSTTYNVIAETIGGDHENVIHMSGHSDSVAAGPGINDNGSGTISLLEITIQLTNFSVTNAVRFSWWSGEEEGLLGATYYVSQQPQSELDKIRLMLDFDMMASPNYAYQIYDGDGSAFGESGPPGSGEAEHEFERYFAQDAGLNFTSIAFDGRSDYGPFLAAGVATGGIACGAEGIKTVEEAAMFGGQAGVAYDACYHSACDDYGNLDVGAWMQMTKAIAHMTATFARSFGSSFLPGVKQWKSSEWRSRDSSLVTRL